MKLPLEQLIDKMHVDDEIACKIRSKYNNNGRLYSALFQFIWEFEELHGVRTHGLMDKEDFINHIVDGSEIWFQDMKIAIRMQRNLK
jgi:hypothetical protein